jgi:hypothetical protein
MRLPGAVLGPSALLLPRDCLLLGTLRLLVLLRSRLGTLGPLLWRLLSRSGLLGPLLWHLLSRSGLLGPLLWHLLSRSGLLGPLLLWRLLSRSGLLGPLLLWLLSWSSLLGPLLLRLLSRSSLLGPLLLWLLSRSSLLGPLLLRLLSRSGLLGPLLLWLPFGLAFFLRVRRVNRPEEHKQGSGTDNSNQLHLNHPPSLSLLCLHSDNQSAEPLFQRLGVGLGLVHRPIRAVGRVVSCFLVS